MDPIPNLQDSSAEAPLDCEEGKNVIWIHSHMPRGA
jgi:hypothetical protein